jgi:hypothetical protein
MSLLGNEIGCVGNVDRSRGFNQTGSGSGVENRALHTSWKVLGLIPDEVIRFFD